MEETTIFILNVVCVAIVLYIHYLVEKAKALKVTILVVILYLIAVGIGEIEFKPKEQPKYKQEIVYSLKDGKYLPTDTIYTEIK